ncbi:cryptochrome [Trichoderma reesei RUT C-30]|uniref:Cryptochrome n=2 Tax=Hypocrea jecorina TaxID=51453 RepID=A0A024SEL3_HYPJR|nr:cryptochrome [Trichoderma reesei RUT C-30]
MSGGRIVVYLLGQDLRTADNPILHYLSITGSEHGYTHLLPVYVLPPDQIDLSGLVKDGETFPYPHALTGVGRYWKCGIHRVRFLVESVWDLKSKLEALGSGLIIRAGSFPDVLEGIVQHYADQQDGPQVAAVWMTKGFLPVEVSEQQAIASFCDEVGLRFVSFRDHKWFIDNPELSTRSILELPDKFSEFQTRIGRMEYQPRRALPPPLSFSLPPYPDHASLPTQKHPFDIPDTLPKLFEVLSKQVGLSAAFKEIGSRSLPAVFPARGGETQALNRLRYVIKKGIVSQYHTTIDDLKEQDGCFNLSAYLSLGCISARQVHEELVRLEQGTEPDFAQALGFGKGENMGTKALRAEMLHIDFIRLCNRKYGQSVYSPEGSGPGRNPGIYYKTPNRNKARPDQVPCPLGIEGILVQFQVGATGFGLIDAIMRQLLCTGYISIRSQMLAANFLGKFAGVDWRYGVEWVASLSIEHDASLHWHRWQHYVGIGPDPSGGEVTFSPAHAALEFDPDGHFVREWMPELRRLTALPNLFRVATTPPELLQLLGLATSVMVTRPVPFLSPRGWIRIRKQRAIWSRWLLCKMLRLPVILV